VATNDHRRRLPELYDPAWLAANVYAGSAADVADELGCSIASVTKARHRYQVLLRNATSADSCVSPADSEPRPNRRRSVLGVSGLRR
jgi:hypothetical protein